MKKLLIIISSALLLIFSLLPVGKAAAETPPAPTPIQYHLLVPLPGISENAGEGVTTEAYLKAVFNLLIGLSFVLAVIMIVLGGVQYMSTDAVTGKSAGKERIQNALIGLLLILASFLILKTIDPDLVSFRALNETPSAKGPDQKDASFTGGGSSGSFNNSNGETDLNPDDNMGTDDPFDEGSPDDLEDYGEED